MGLSKCATLGAMNVNAHELLKIVFAVEKAGNRPTLIAIDGHSGAGKTTVSNWLKDEHENVQIVRTDDFYRVMPPDERKNLSAAEGYDRYYDWTRLRADVLIPLCAGKHAVYRKYNWQANELGESASVGANGFIVVEGCYSARPELKDYYDAIVIVKAPEERRMKVQTQRGDDWGWVERWDAAERYYMEQISPESYATLVWLNE